MLMPDSSWYPWKLCLIKYELDINVSVYLNKSDLNISCLQETMEKLTEINTFWIRKTTFFPHFWSDQCFKGTVVNRAFLSLHEGSLERTLTEIASLLTQLSDIAPSGAISRIKCRVSDELWAWSLTGAVHMSNEAYFNFIS